MDGLSVEVREVVRRERSASERVLERVLALIEPGRRLRPRSIVHHWRHSNDLLQVGLGGRELMLKRAVRDWAEPAFRSARRAARLLRTRTGVVVPEYLDLPVRLDGHAVVAYWRVPLPTLAEAWPGMDAAARRSALRSWGDVLRRVHGVPADGVGPLAETTDPARSGTCSPARPGTGAGAFFRSDLLDRLLPAAWGEWPEGAEAIQRLAERAWELDDRVGTPVLLHGDLHWSNVLYDPERERCVGLIDLEAVMGGPPEADLAYLEVVHSPHMAGPPAEGWLDEVREGYGDLRSGWLVRFFRAWHLLNMGYYAAHTGWRERGGQVARAAGDEIAGL